MKAKRATDNIQQKASDCLATEVEKEYSIGHIIIDQSKAFAFVRSRKDLSLAEVLGIMKRNTPRLPKGGIENGTDAIINRK